MKNRSNVFNVVRIELYQDEDYEYRPSDMHTVGTYRTSERAEEVAATYNQQVDDGVLPNGFTFEVQASVFYDE